MFDDNKKIEEELEKVIIEYTEGREDRIKSDYTREKAVANDYRGREILELLQNAEDAAYENIDTRGQGKVKISLLEDKLTIKNTGNPFNISGIKSIMLADNSPKDPILTDVIGNKGLGFRAILSWAKSVKIVSSKVSVIFNEQSVNELKEKIILRNPVRKEIIEKQKLSILTAPKIINIDKNSSKEYDTTIEIICDTEAFTTQNTLINEIENSIKNVITAETLVFLKNINEIEVNINGASKKYTKTYNTDTQETFTDDSGVISKQCISIFIKDEEYKYWLFNQEKPYNYFDKEKDKNITKKIQMGIAMPIDFSLCDNYLYSFFKTQINCPFKFLINATFELQQNRNKLLLNNEVNKNVISYLIPFIYGVASSLKGKEDLFSLFKSLIIKDSTFLSDYNFYNQYIDFIKNKPILPNANCLLICPSGYIGEEQDYDCPIVSQNDFSEICSGELFNNLVLYNNDREVVDFIDEFEIQHYDVDNLVDTLNSYIENYKFSDLKDKIFVCTKLLFLYKNEFVNAKIFPKLFLNSNGNFQEKDNGLFYMESSDTISPPKWLDIEFASNKQIMILAELYSCGIDNILSKFNSILKPYNFDEIAKVISEKSEEELEIEKIIELNKWIFFQYKFNKTQFKSGVKNLNVKLLYGNKNKPQVAFAKQIYFPDHYGNHFIHGLLKKSKCKFLIGKSILGLEGGDKELIDYYENLGVNTYPRLINITETEKIRKYFFANTKVISESEFLKDKYNSRYFYNFKLVYKFTSVEYLEDILKNTFSDIIIFFNKLEKFYGEKISDIIENNSNDSIKIQYFYSYSKYIQEVNIPLKLSYSKWLISTISWIDYLSEGKTIRIAPNKCNFDNINLHGYFEKPFWDINKLKTKDKNLTENYVKLLLEKLGVNNSIEDLSADEIYELLYALPNFDPDGIVARSVYTKAYDAIKDDDLITSLAYENFLKEGKVCAIKNKIKNYYPVSEVKYSANKTFCDEILNDVVFFDFTLRQGVPKIEKLFGVQKLDSNSLTILDKELVYNSLNTSFQEAYKQLKPFIVVKRKQVSAKGNDVKLLKDSNIYLVDELNVSFEVAKDDVNTYFLNDFSFVYISNEKKGYVVIPKNVYTNINELMRNTEFADALAELICLILTVSSGKESYREFIKESCEDRELLLIKDLGEGAVRLLCDVRKEFNIISSKKELFFSTLKNIVKNKKNLKILDNKDVFNADNFDFENINNIKNSEMIIALFKQLGIDIPMFNSNSEVCIDLRKYYNEEYGKLLNDYLDRFKTLVYSNSIELNPENRISYFKKAINNYQFNRNLEFNNSVNFIVKDYYEEVNKINISDLPEVLNFDQIVDENINKYKESYPSNYNEISKYDKNSIYNYALLDILDIYYCKNCNDGDLMIEIKDTVTINYDELKKNIDDNFKNSGRILTTQIESPQINPKANKTCNVHTNSNNFGLNNEATKQSNGFIAEYYAYKMLCKEYGELNVNWISKNSTYDNRDKDYDDSCHYDIEISKGKQREYVEVKKIDPNDFSFDITKGEVEFGEANPNNYHIYCVAVLDKKDVPEKSFLIKKFFKYDKNEGFTHNKKFIVNAKDFRIKTKILSEN